MKTSRLILGLMTLGLILSITSGALASSVPSSAPSGVGTSNTGGIFAEYFQKLAKKCPINQMVTGFETGSTDYLTPICNSLSYLASDEFIDNLFLNLHFSGALTYWLDHNYIGPSSVPGSSQWHDVLTNSIAYTGTNVGIGTNTPSAGFKLEVNGDAKINGLTVGKGGGSLIGNTANGYGALMSNTTGYNNTAIGKSALVYNSTGSYNTANGVGALLYNTTGYNNTANGMNTLISNTIGSNNTAIGGGADVTSVNLSNVTLIGANTFGMQSDTVILGNGANVGIGTSTPGAKLEVVGQVKIVDGNQGAGKVLTSDANGLATWSTSSGPSGSSQWQNVALGISYMGTNVGIGTLTPGAKLEVNGDAKINSLTVGRGGGSLIGNTAIGLNTLRQNTTGNYNTAIGLDALYNNTTGNYNTANGNGALLYNTTGNDNTANGWGTLTSNTTGNGNTANGKSALYYNTTGNDNTANGLYALVNNTTGNGNTAIGLDALYYNTTGNGNTANGSYALLFNTTGDTNIAIGEQALYYNTTGSYNTANGAFALQNNTTGNYNTANGNIALYSNTTGNGNTANGMNALFNNTTGTNNTAIGSFADVTSGNLSNVTLIGANTVGSQSNTVILGNGANVGIGTSTPGAKLEVVGNIIAASPTQDNHVATKAYVDAAIATAVAAALAGQPGGCTTIGSPCGGGIYAGDYLGHKIIATPSGCTDSTTPTCNGSTDTLTKQFSTELVDRNTTNSYSDGVSNTATLAAFGALYPAAKYCDDMVYGGKSDWYLPAPYELNILNDNKVIIGGFTTNNYWSSMEGYTATAWCQSFPNSMQANYGSKYYNFYVRCIRKI